MIATGLASACGPFHVVHGPDSCQVATDVNNDFEGPVRGNLFAYDSGFRAVGLAKSKKATYLTVFWATAGVVNARVEEGAKLEVALQGGEILELTVRKTANPVAGANGSGVFTRWNTEAELDDGKLAKLAEHGVTSIRTTLGGNEFTQKVFADPSARLQTLAIRLGGAK